MGLPCVVIRLDEPETDCSICGRDVTGLRLAIPMYEDMVLPNTWAGPWVGSAACSVCYLRQGALDHPVTKHAFTKALD